MATEKTTPKKTGRSMTPVLTTVSVAGGALRDPEGGTVWPSGRTVLNTNAHEMWVSLVKAAGLDPGTVKTWFAVDKPNSIVGAYPTAGGVQGASQVKQYDSSNTSIHLGGVFQENPKLRPKGKRQVTIGIETDAEGRDFLSIDLQTAMIKRTTTRDTADSEPKAKKVRAKKAAEVEDAADQDSEI